MGINYACKYHFTLPVVDYHSGIDCSSLRADCVFMHGCGQILCWINRAMCGAHPVVYLFGFPSARPFGLPSASDRLDGVGLTGHPALDGLKWTSLSISPLTVRCFGAARSPKQINHRMRTERPHRCDLAHHLSSGVGAIGESGRDYVQEEVRPGEPGREGGLGHVRRDWFRFVHNGLQIAVGGT